MKSDRIARRGGQNSSDVVSFRRRPCGKGETHAGSDLCRRGARVTVHQLVARSSDVVSFRRRPCGMDASRAGSDLLRREARVASLHLVECVWYHQHRAVQVARQRSWCAARREFGRRLDVRLHRVRALRHCRFATKVNGAYFEPLLACQRVVRTKISDSLKIWASSKVCGPKEFFEKGDSMRARTSLSV